MTDYSNPQIMKEVMNEAKEAGIFAKGVDKKIIKETYFLKVNNEDASTLSMFRDNPKYGYKLVQINFTLGLSSKIKSNTLKIKEVKSGMFSSGYTLEIKQSKDKSQRAWDEVHGKPLVFYFQSKDGFIEGIIPKRSYLIKDYAKENSGEKTK